MILTVTTLKDTLPNVQRFVAGNLAGGIDHLIVFLDAADPEVESWLTAQPDVTLVVTDRSWWNGERPRLLNRRQRLNANLARAVLTRVEGAEWLFHLDADEIARIDRAELAAVPADAPAVNLRPLEVVSQLRPAGEPRLFKRLLEEPDLLLLEALGVLDEPDNDRYFRSHIAGKVGVRPRLDVWLGIHKAVDHADDRLPLHRSPGLEMLHLESYSGEEFVRKWTAMIGSGPRMNFGEHRMKLATALKAVVTKDLAPEEAAHFLTAIYERHMQDPVDVLSRLGLLTEVDPLSGDHRPERLPQEQSERLRSLLEALRGEDKWQFLPERAGAAEVTATMDRIAGRPSGSGRRGLFRRS
ncbi:glycosyltransferase family 2 protein [Nocardioides sp. URHA0020]|uniref:glycosyltransferase family 2 protein n=1 Tax=Nocardioides sp. URHA0020 TaxID=1380392 RepID=UPI00048F4BB2|nr:glycosyltransferase family 2 protein [Nocardioides sp. URHA0020]